MTTTTTMMMTMRLVTLSLLLVFCLSPLGDAADSTFSVFWNAPSASCYQRGIHLDLDKYEIKHNSHLSFKGKVKGVVENRHRLHSSTELTRNEVQVGLQVNQLRVREHASVSDNVQIRHSKCNCF